MAGRQVFLLERRDAMFRCVHFTGHLLLRQQSQGGSKFLYINFPIAAAFERTAQGHDGREDRMAVPAPRQVPYLRPWIRIQDVMPGRAYAAVQQQAPVIDQIGAYAQAIVWNRTRPLCIACDAIC